MKFKTFKTGCYGVFFTWLCIVACTGVDQQIKEKHPPGDFFTVIIHNNSGNPFYIWKEQSYSDIHAFEISTTLEKDTVDFPIAPYEYIYLSHRGVTGDTLLVARGDTIKVGTTPDELTYNHITHNDTLLHFQSAYTQFLEEEEWVAITKRIDALHASVLPRHPSASPREMENERQKSILYALNRQNVSNPNSAALDTLLILLQKKHRAALDFAEELGTTHSSILSDRLSHMLTLHYNEKVRSYQVFFPDIVPDSLFVSISFDKDFLHTPYARKYVQSFLYREIIQPEQKRSRRRSADYKLAYEHIPHHWSDSLSKFARFISIEMMVDTDESAKDVQRYYDDFMQRYPEDRFTSALKEKYLFDLQKYQMITSDIQLIDHHRQMHTFGDILEKLHGHVLYIDFWASWCVPCRIAMPESKRLAQHFSDQPVTFLYLSIDNDVDKWKGATHAEGLSHYEHSYLVVNPKHSEMLQQLELESIPRYLVYDQKGILVHQQAPGPETPDLVDIIKRYIDK